METAGVMDREIDRRSLIEQLARVMKG